MNEEQRKDFESILESGFDPILDPTQRDRLNELLKDDLEAQQSHIEHCQMHSMLAWEHGNLPPIEFYDDLQTAIINRLHHKMLKSASYWRRLAIAAIVVAVVAATWGSIRRPIGTRNPVAETNAVSADLIDTKEENIRNNISLNVVFPILKWSDRRVVASVTQSVGAGLNVEGTSVLLKRSDSVRPGRYELPTGLVELTFTNGIEMIIESPATFDIESEMRVILYQGNLAVKVTPEGEGFVVDTPSASIVDYGTEFAVTVSTDQVSEVHVFDGEVDVRPRRAPENSRSVRLTTNQATRVVSSGIFPQGIDINSERFVRDLNDSHKASSAYERLIEGLAATMQFRMEASSDGRALLDDGITKTMGLLHCEKMELQPWASGRIGCAIRLGGPAREAYGNVAHYPKSETDKISVSVWVRPESRPRWASIAKNWAVELPNDGSDATGLGGQFHFGLHEDAGDLEVQVRDRKGRIAKLRGGEPIRLHTWHHVAFVADGETLSLYQNGRIVAQTRCDGVATDAPEWLGIGAKLNPEGSAPDERNPGFWHGRIDELLIFHTALTTEEIEDLHSTSL